MNRYLDVHNRLIERLRREQSRPTLREMRAVIMNDFSLDHMVPVSDYNGFDARARDILTQKGGILLSESQALQQGGCAANTATTLARLGVPTSFICRTSPLGFVILEFFLGRAGVDLIHSKDDGALAVMTALEVGEQKVNIMINDLGSFTPFGFGDLNADDLALIESATLVGVLDWCLNRAGTDLAAGVLDHLAARPQCADVLVYFDSSDPAPRKDEVPEMVARVLRHPRLNYLGVNEHELRHYAGSAGSGIMDDTPAGMEAMARTLNRTVPATTSAHTAALAIQVDEGPPEKVWLAPSYNLQPKRTTGAGDTWNGGNMLGILLGLETDERLLLANAVAGYYIAAPEAVRPTLAEVIDFMEHHKDGLRPIALPAYASDGRAGSR